MSLANLQQETATKRECGFVMMVELEPSTDVPLKQWLSSQLSNHRLASEVELEEI